MLAARVVLSVVAIYGAAVVAGAAEAQSAPNYISYQGTLYLGSDGVTPVTGVSDIEFRLYNNETDPVDQAVWAEKHVGVSIFNGIFNIYLGGGNPIEGVSHAPLADVFDSTPRWLGIKAGLDDEMTQRQIISSVPYAMTATHVSTATHGVPPGTIVMYAGATAPEGWVMCQGQSLNAEASPEYEPLWQAIGNTWGGSGKTSFGLPNLGGKAMIGVTTSGKPAAGNNVTTAGADPMIQPRPVVGTQVGSSNATLVEANLPSHKHGYQDREGDIWPMLDLFELLDKAGGGPISPVIPAPQTGSAGGGGAHNNVQPSVYMNFIIKL